MIPSKKHINKTEKPFKIKGFSPLFSIKKLKNPDIFVVVSKKVDKKAVNRNLIRRRTKEALRQTDYFKKNNGKNGLKIYPTKNVAKADFLDLISELKNLLK